MNHDCLSKCAAGLVEELRSKLSAKEFTTACFTQGIVTRRNAKKSAKEICCSGSIVLHTGLLARAEDRLDKCLNELMITDIIQFHDHGQHFLHLNMR